MMGIRRKNVLNQTDSHELVAVPPQSDVSPSLPLDRLALVTEAIHGSSSINFAPELAGFELEEDRTWFDMWPGEHYKFLRSLAAVLRPKLALDIGTYHGASALAIAPYSEQVRTYDIVPLAQIGNAYTNLLGDNPNMTQEIGDLANPDFYGTQKSKIHEADLVIIDGPKDGVFEYKVVPKVIQDMKSGSLLVLDDIRFSNMKDLWMGIGQPRIDVGSFAHSSGTGIVFL
jgi:predicted O-methyltransferase YrrM